MLMPMVMVMVTLMRRMLTNKFFVPLRACWDMVFDMRFRGSQFPYLVIWLLSVFGWVDVDAMTMLRR